LWFFVETPETGRFISEEIEVVSEDFPKRPLEFTWRGKRYKVVRIVSSWLDWGFPGGSPKRTNWRLRRHRNCFLLEADDERLYEIHLDRSARGGKGAWVLSRAFKSASGS
jgi:hypothetical protein